MTHTRTRAASAIATVSIATLIANAGLPTHSWLAPLDGDWNIGANWSALTAPDASSSVEIGLVGAYTVSVSSGRDAMSLSITNPNAVLGINNASTLNLFGDLANEGMIIINPASSSSSTQLDFEADAMLTGTGTILLNSIGSRAQIRTGAGVTFTQGLQHTIEGFGQITGSMLNNGTIDANVGTLTLALNGSDKANNTIMRASNGGELEISSISINQGTNGTIAADGADSVVDFSFATINNGNLQSTNDGIVTVSTATFDGVDFLQGDMHILNARTLDIFNSITNNGVITLNPGGGGSATTIDFESTGSFFGTGDLVLDSFGSRARLRTAAGVTMTNSASHTIRGYGQIESDFINDGVVNANVAGQELFMNFNPKLNNASMMASNGGIIDFASIPVAQSGSAEILADGAGSRVDFNSTSITGGDITATNGATIEINGATYDGVTAMGPHNVANATTLDVFNSIVNNGTITINPLSSGSATQLDFENTGAFLGNGEVLLNSFDARARLRTGVGATMTNSSTHTIRGYGRIEASLINDGLIRADIPAQFIQFNTNNKVNNATIESINDALLQFTSITVDQSGGGEITADGPLSVITMNSASIINGDLVTTNGALINVINSTFDAVNFDGTLHIQNATSLDVFNSILNNGSIVINPNASGSATQLDFENSGSFLGNGEVVLASFDSRSRLRTAVDQTMTNTANHTIRGYGRIEATLINNGTVRAEVPANAIFMNTNDKVNNATMSAVNEAELEL